MPSRRQSQDVASPDLRAALAKSPSSFGIAESRPSPRASGMKPMRISPASPWQNGVAERWIGSCRRELIDHLIVLNEAHLRRLIRDYISYYHTDRIHDSLEKDTPAKRPVSSKPNPSARL